MEDQPTLVGTRWTGWIMIVIGSVLLTGFLSLQALRNPGANTQPAWIFVAPLVLSVIVITCGAALLWLLKEEEETSD